jgi:hypothetical protein
MNETRMTGMNHWVWTPPARNVVNPEGPAKSPLWNASATAGGTGPEGGGIIADPFWGRPAKVARHRNNAGPRRLFSRICTIHPILPGSPGQGISTLALRAHELSSRFDREHEVVVSGDVREP